MQTRSEMPTVPKLLAVFVLLTCARVWLGPVSEAAPAAAQLPDSAAQRNEMIAQARRTNELLEEIADTLRSGTINVRVDGADKKTDKKPPGPGAGKQTP